MVGSHLSFDNVWWLESEGSSVGIVFDWGRAEFAYLIAQMAAAAGMLTQEYTKIAKSLGNVKMLMLGNQLPECSSKSF